MNNYRPLILLGNGMRNNPALIEHICDLGIPICTTWMACDLLPEDSPVFIGRPGIFGGRCANICQQKATHLYCFGARLDGEQIFYDYESFAPNAIKYIHDIDATELEKFPTNERWLKSTKNILEYLERPSPAWLAWCKDLYNRFRPELEGRDNNPQYVDPFSLIRLLGEHSKPDDVFAIGSSGNAPTAFYQAFKVKAGQRVSNVCTIGSMGADIPMALGAALATGRRVICVTGDGGFQMNAQELETIRRLRLPVIFFVLNNNGYNSIRVAQKLRFGRVTGADPSSGLTLPSIEAIAEAYRWAYMPLRGRDLPGFARALGFAPMIVEVFVDPDWQQLPRVMATTENGEFVRDDMQNMFPYLPADELERIMNE